MSIELHNDYWSDRLSEMINKVQKYYINKYTNETFFKYVIYVLSEAKSCCDEDRYFSINRIIENQDSTYRFEQLYMVGILEMNREIEEYFYNILFNGLNEEMMNGKISDFEKTDFALRLKEYPDLYENVVNYIINDYSFDGLDIFEFKGYSIKILVEKYHLSIFGACNMLIAFISNPDNIDTLIDNLVHINKIKKIMSC